jgi:hypothetical protein
LSVVRRLWSLWLLALLASVVHADDTKSPARKPVSAAATPASKAAPTASNTEVPGADDELLEFLGSVGEESDGEWIDYLSKTDISKVAREKAKTSATSGVNK